MNNSELTQSHSLKSLEPIWAYALLGWLIGTFPPAITFVAMFATQSPDPSPDPNAINLTGLFVLIAVICSVAGLITGAFIGLLMKFLRRVHWILPIVLSPILGLIWAVITGGAGGFPVFVVGAIFGAVYAAPFGILGFLLFSTAYESLARRRDLLWRQIVALHVGTLVLLIAAELFWLFVLNK